MNRASSQLTGDSAVAPRTTREGGVLVASGGRLIPGNTGGRPAPVGWSTGGSQVKNLFSSRSVVAEPGVVSKACRERERELRTLL